MEQSGCQGREPCGARSNGTTRKATGTSPLSIKGTRQLFGHQPSRLLHILRIRTWVRCCEVCEPNVVFVTDMNPR